MTPETLTATSVALVSECRLTHAEAFDQLIAYLADWEVACKAHEAGKFKVAEKAARKLLAMLNFPEFARIEFLIMLGFVVDDHSEATSFRDRAECLWKKHVPNYVPGKTEGLDDIRDALDDLSEELELEFGRSEDTDEEEDEAKVETEVAVAVEREAEGTTDNSASEHPPTTVLEEAKENVAPLDDGKDDLGNGLHNDTYDLELDSEPRIMQFHPYIASNGTQTAPAVTLESFENGFAYFAL